MRRWLVLAVIVAALALLPFGASNYVLTSTSGATTARPLQRSRSARLVGAKIVTQRGILECYR